MLDSCCILALVIQTKQVAKSQQNQSKLEEVQLGKQKYQSLLQISSSQGEKYQ